jgi:hypothetical protein
MQTVFKMCALLLVLTTLVGCATVQHPNKPGVQYGSVEACQQANASDVPMACTTTIHKEATAQAATIAVGTFAVMAYIALLFLLVLGGGR